jgi:hypothetical protein
MNIKQSFVYQTLGNAYHRLLEFLEPVTVPIALFFSRKAQEKERIRLREKKVLKCVFLVVDDSIWKCDAIYRAMEESPDFEPIVMACAVPGGSGYIDKVAKMNQVFQMFENRGYRVIKSFNQETGETVNLRGLDPDLIVYTKPFNSLYDKSYAINKFKDKLTIYIPYYINGTNDYDLAYNLPIHNFSWRYYVESQFHKQLAEKYSLAKGKNVIVTGYPGIEDFINPEYRPVDSWKLSDKCIKRIIWAPHQSIVESKSVNYSAFLEYCDFMLEMAKKYKDKVQFAYKPHPLLKKRLYKLWGEEKTDAYYNEWATMPNTMISDSDYHDLFLTSDALIHDCGSFTIEYLYLNKPVMRLMNKYDPTTMFGDFGMACINQHYLAYSKDDIQLFIENVIAGKDEKKEERTRFIKENLQQNGELPSKLILADIINTVRN